MTCLSSSTVILQLICPDRPGLVSELATWIAKNNGNIRHADHHTDEREALFLSRIEWDLEGFKLSRDSIIHSADLLAAQVNGRAELTFSDELPRVAIFVSKQSHCLLDLLWRVQNGEIPIDVSLIISNHQDLISIAKDFSVDFKYIPVSSNDKLTSEKIILETLSSYRIDVVVLAKYMQILTANFIDKFPTIINIHHSFLPAFKGAQPYHQAWQRGVKLIGATAHYVTEELDDGPIIDQTIAYVTHRDEVDDLIRKGRDTERLALSRALRLHIRRQVMVYSGKTAVFA